MSIEKKYSESSLLYPTGQDPITLGFESVGFTAITKNENKVILESVSGIVRPGELLAIMGASGAGKTTLLNILAQRVEGKGYVSGKITINGRLAPNNLAAISGYVMQEDIFLGSLSVRETLTFRAKLVLGNKSSGEMVSKRVNSVLEELGLKKCSDSRVGGGLIRGISGGEKKRLSVALELIARPSLIFLDEPTSGLDSFTSYNVMDSLRRIAQNSRTVVCTIHQPRSNIYGLFDKILLLSEGKLIYFGDASKAVDYFDTLGYPCPKLMNPTDFFLDTISVDYRSSEAEEESKKRIELFASQFSKTSSYQKIINSNEEKYVVETEISSGFWRQLLILFQRNFSVTLRAREATIARIFQSLFLGVIIGLIFLQLGLESKSVQDRQGLLFLVVVQQSFGGLFSALILFQQEKEIFVRERRAGLYYVISYYISRFLSELPFVLLSPILFGTIVYFMSGLQTTAENFLNYIITLCLTTLTAQSMGFAISTGSPNIEVANIVAPLLVVILFLFGGFYANLESIPVYLSWLEYISFIKWGFEVLVVNEFTGLIFECGSEICPYPDGESVIKFLSMEDVSIPVNFGILAGIVGLFQLIAFIFLQFLRK